MMLRVKLIFLCIAAVSLAQFPRDVRAQQKQPRVYIDRGACEGEACAYGLWKPLETTPLYARPSEGSRKVGEVRAGPCVEAVTGEVHVVPGRFKVIKPYEVYKPGDVLGVYTYHGEDTYKVRHRGLWRHVNLSYGQPPDAAAEEKCARDKYCWGVFTRKPDAVWWVKIRTAGGLVGWTYECTHFEQPYWLAAGACEPLPRTRRARRLRRTS